MKHFFTYLLTLLTLVSCSPASKGEQDNIVQKETRPYRLTVNGKPFLMLGAQLRTDFFLQLDGRKLDELDEYFSLAAGLNITCIQVPVSWRDVEIEYDVYSPDMVHAWIDYCEKYNLKLEILWFGSYMCGYSVEGYIPDYVISDSSTYKDLNPSAAFNGWLGKHYYLSPGNTALLDRETRAIGKMMEFIKEYDSRLGNPHTVIGVQIENEPDMLATRHNSAHGYSPTDLWPSLLHHLDAIGKAVKSSGYDCYTRVNQTTTYDDWVYWSGMVAKREGIDYVGFDPYVNDVTTLDRWLAECQMIEGNFAHVAENGGEYYNNDVMTLSALTKGCGYEVFEVITTPHPYLKDWTLRGVYNPDFTPKGQTQRLIDAYSVIKAAWYDFATAQVKDMVGFNIFSSEGQASATQTLSTSTHIIGWKTSSRGIAFAIEGEGYLTIGSTKADEFSLSREPKGIETGRYDSDGKWIPVSKIAATQKLNVRPCEVYRIIY